MSQATRTLGGFPLFRNLAQQDLQRVESSCSWRQVAAQEWVVDREGEGTDVFFVLHGHLRVVVSVGGRETILRDLKAGEFFGELAALDLKPRSAGIVAIANSLLARMPAAAFRDAIHQHADVCDQVLAVLVGQIRVLANRTNEVSGLSMKHRLCAELLRLARPAMASPGFPVITPPPTHSELAARVSSHREAVTRELGALERAGLIARRRGAISLLDAERLRRMVSEAIEG
jgi:CRP/FNR family transcriptional regulator, cyclic AMP receptor protein